MNRITINMLEIPGVVLKIGDDIGGLAPNDYVVESFGEPFENDKGLRMIPVTLVKRSGKLN